MKRLMTVVLLALTSPAFGAAAWHVDERAGVRFRIPFADYVEKTGHQVEALLLDEPAYRRLVPSLPEGLTYTSGVYARGSDAFVLVWTTPRTELPSRAALRDLSRGSELERFQRFGVRGFRFNPETLRGVGRQPTRHGLRSRVLVQLARDATIYVGFYYSKSVDEARFESLLASFTLQPDKRVDTGDLPHGIPAAMPTLMAALAAALAALGTVLLIRRAYQPRGR